MDSDKLPLDETNQNLVEPDINPSISPTISFWRKYRSVAILVCILVAIGVAVAVFNHQPTQTISSVKTVAPSTAIKQSSSNNVWQSTTLQATQIPLGDNKVSTAPQLGYVDSCTTNFRGGGARHAGNWINTTDNTWNSQTKVAVEGSVAWPSAQYSATTSGSNRLITTNDLPDIYLTGNYPISHSDPAYQYDTNPNAVAAQNLSYSLPINPTAAATPGCLSLGPIGILSDGVLLFDALDDAGRDAVAHETQDLCNGHPNGQEMYHYHNVPSCILDKATGSSTLVGYAFDGYGIYVERDARGNLPTNADLDVCHGRTSQVDWNGALTSIYHYDATLEYPYTVGCFHGTSVVSHG